MRPASAGLAALGALAVAILASPVASAQPPRPFFGVGPQTVLGPADVGRMAAGGVGTLRLNFSWPAADPHPPYGGLRWGGTDAVVADAAEAGIRVLPVLYGTPTWVAELDGHQCRPACQTYMPRSRAALRAWAAFVTRAVRRYGPQGRFWQLHPEVPPRPIRAWQIWNEQNSGQYVAPRPSARVYGDLLMTASRAIRALDPDAEVVLGGMFADPDDDHVFGYQASDFLERLYRIEGIESQFDGLGIHPYAAKLKWVREQVEALRAVAAAAGDGEVDSWITEIGCASGGIVHPLNVGPEGQARFLTRAYRMFINRRRLWRVKAVIWFSWRDSEGAPICKWCPESGLFDSAFGLPPKPAWFAYTRLSGGR